MASRHHILMAHQFGQVLLVQLFRGDLAERVAELIGCDVATTTKDRAKTGDGVGPSQSAQENGLALAVRQLAEDLDGRLGQVDGPGLTRLAGAFVANENAGSCSEIDLLPTESSGLRRSATSRRAKTEDAFGPLGQAGQNLGELVGIYIAGLPNRLAEFGHWRNCTHPAFLDCPSKALRRVADAIDHGPWGVSAFETVTKIDEEACRQSVEKPTTGKSLKRSDPVGTIGRSEPLKPERNEMVDYPGGIFIRRSMGLSHEAVETNKGGSVLGQAGSDRVGFAAFFSMSNLLGSLAEMPVTPVDACAPVALGVDVRAIWTTGQANLRAICWGDPSILWRLAIASGYEH